MSTSHAVLNRCRECGRLRHEHLTRREAMIAAIILSGAKHRYPIARAIRRVVR